MKKVFVSCLLIIFCLCFISCTEKDSKTVYQEFIAEIEKEMSNGFENKTFEDLQISSVFMYYENSELGYCYLDIDNNGTEELVMGRTHPDKTETVVYGVYTVKSGKIVRTVDGWERKRFYICDNGLMACHGSNGAANSEYSYYEYSNNQLVLVEAVIFDGMKDEKNPWFYSKEATTSDKASPITKEEASAIIDSYHHLVLDLTLFEYED